MKKIIKLLLPGYSIDEKIYLRYKVANLFWKCKLNFFANFVVYRTYRKYHCIISYKANINGKINLPHPLGIVIGEGVTIEENVTIYQNVTLGRKNKDIAAYPIIGKNVIIYANSILLGNIKVRDDSIIGCNSVILRDIERGEVVKGIVK